MRRFYYVFSLLFVFCLPALGSYLFLKDRIYVKALIPFIILITVMGSIWDIWATRHGRKDTVWLWQFNRRDTLGIRFFDLPIEEYFFYVSGSTYAVFMWEGIKIIRNEGLLEAYLLVIGMAVWTLISVAIPYLFAPRGDKFIH